MTKEELTAPTRTIETERYIIEQVRLNNGIWVANKRWSKVTLKREL